jgi:hypothetical protein
MMPESDILVNTNPEDVSQNPGATGLSDPFVSITGALADYANRQPPPANSLGLLMDDQQMRDAGLHPEQSGAQPTYSVIDASGADEPEADPAGGYAEAIRRTRGAATGAHNAASGMAQAAIISNALKAGQALKPALAQAANNPMVKGLKTLNQVYSAPLYAAESIARGVTDLQNGAPKGDAMAGNLIRGGLVTTSSLLPVPGLAWAANKYLPDGAVMGHAYNQSFADTDGRALLLP